MLVLLSGVGGGHHLVMLLSSLFEEFQDLLYDLVKQAIVGVLEVEEVVSFLNELSNALVSSR